MLEVPSDRDPREIHIEIQNPAYYLGINIFYVTFYDILIGKYFLDEVVFEDLECLSDDQVAEIYEIGDRYLQIIFRALGVK